MSAAPALAAWLSDDGRFDRAAPSDVLDLTAYPIVVELAPDGVDEAVDPAPRGFLAGVADHARDQQDRIEVAIIGLAIVAFAMVVGRFALALLHGWHP